MAEDFLSVLPRPVRVETPQTLLEVRIRAGKRIALRYLDRERPQLTARYPDFERFDAGFAVSPAMMSELAEMAAAQGIEPAGDEAAQSDGLLKLQIKALVAERLFPREGFYRVMNAADGSMFRRAVELLGAWSEQGKHILSKRK